MQCSERITNILNPEYVYSSEDFGALVACNDAELLEILYRAARSDDYRRQVRLRDVLSMRLCLHLLELMVLTTEHDDATAALLHMMISAKKSSSILPSGRDQEMSKFLFPDIRAADRLFTLLYRDDTSISWIAAQALALIDDGEIVGRLQQEIGEGDSVHQMKTALALAWCRDAHVLPALLAALSNGDWLVRQLACKGLRVLADARAVAALSHMVLEDEESLVRDAAAEALGNIGGHAVVTPLIEALRDPDEDVRATAAHQLGALQDPQAIDPLSNILRSDPNVMVRSSAIQAFRDMACGVEQIIAALQDNSPDVRAAAAGALEDFQDSRSFAPLITALDDPDTDVRYIAADTLSEIRSFDTDDPAVTAKIRHLLQECYGR